MGLHVGGLVSVGGLTPDPSGLNQKGADLSSDRFNPSACLSGRYGITDSPPSAGLPEVSKLWWGAATFLEKPT